MLRPYALLLVVLLGCAEVAPPAPARPRDTTQLARIEASADLDGKAVGKSDGVTIVVVFASWCQHCQRELDVLAKLRPSYPTLRVLGVNYKGHEEYDGRGSSTAVRRYVTENAPWLRVVPADDPLFDLLGRPRLIPTLYVYNRRGELVVTYTRTDRAMPDGDELRELLRRIGS